jgi:NADPH-dependent curcumin reductase CurA
MNTRQIVLAARPEGLPTESDFCLIESETAELGDGLVLVKTNFLSVDPYLRGRISEM